MKVTFLQVGIQREFFQIVKDLTHCLDMAFFFVLSVDKNIIQIHNNEDIKFFRKNLIDIALNYCWSVGQSKKHHLILEITVFSPKSSFLLIFFANSYPVIDIGEIELDKLPNLP